MAVHAFRASQAAYWVTRCLRGTYAFTVDAQALEPGRTGELPAGQLTLNAR